MKNIYFLALLFIAINISAQQNVNLDPSFSGDGVFDDFDFVSPGDDLLKLAPHPNGGYLIAGQRNINPTEIENFVSKITEDGQLDTSFGTNGFTVVPTQLDNGLAMEVDQNGKIILWGGQGSVELTRLNSDGTFDNTFGTGGVVIVQPSNAYAENNSITQELLVSGNAYYVKWTGTTGNPHFIQKYDDAGNLDTSFATNGTLENNFFIDGIASDNAGNIVSPSFGEISQALTIKKVDTNGMPVSSFGVNGVLEITNPPSYNTAEFIFNDSQNKMYYIMVGTDDGFASDANIVRFNEDGSLDTSFANNGILSLNTSLNYYVTEIIEQDNQLYMMGVKFSDTEDFESIYIARMNYDGSFDTSFNTNGYKTETANLLNPLTENAYLNSDGTIVVAGEYSEVTGGKKYFLAKFIPETLGVNDISVSSPIKVNTLFTNQIKIETQSNELSFAKLFDLNGKFVLQSTQNMIETSHLPKGVYILQVALNNGETVSQKVVKR